jgi:hypothetical protein
MSLALYPIGLVPVGLVAAASGPPPAADTEAPTWTGPITVGTKTSSTIALTLPTAADNVGVVGYQYRVNGGAWVGSTTAVSLAGLAALTAYTVEARALDAAGNASTVLSVTTSTYRAGATGAYILANTGPVGTSLAGFLFDDVEPGDEAKWFSYTIVTPPASGTLAANPDGSFTFTGPDPVFFTYQLEVDGVAVGVPQTVTVYSSGATASVSAAGAMAWSALGAVSVDVLPMPVTVSVSGAATMAWAASGAVQADVIALPPDTVSVSGTAAMAWAASGAVQADVIALPPDTVSVSVIGQAGMLYAALGAVSATVQPLPVSVSVAGSASMIYAGVGAVSATVLPMLPTVDAAISAQAAMLYSAVGAVVVSDSLILWPPAAATAVVPRHNFTAIVPPTGADDMQPIATFEQYTSDKEIYNINFAARYMPEGDTADRLLAVGHDPGVTVTTQVPVGGALPSGVVFFAVDDPIAPGDYKVWVQISTVAGREVTRSVIVNASTV